METPSMPEETDEYGETQGGEGDLRQGYCIYFEVTPNGFSVSDPKPISAKPLEERDPLDGEDLTPDLTTAVKELLAVVKANPLGSNPIADMEAGYQS